MRWDANEKIFLEIWDQGTRRLKERGALAVEQIRAVLPQIRQLVCSPVDKFMADGMLYCPLRWMRAVRKLAGNMKLLSVDEIEQEFRALPKLGKALKELPFAGLKRVDLHEFGTLKGWVKWKNFTTNANALAKVGSERIQVVDGKQVTIKQEWQGLSWDTLKFRPLSSYMRHHWRRILSLASRFCTTCILTLHWGFHTVSPKKVVQDASAYNDRFMSWGGGSLSMDLFDVKEFFPNVDVKLLKQAVFMALDQLRSLNSSWKYF